MNFQSKRRHSVDEVERAACPLLPCTQMIVVVFLPHSMTDVDLFTYTGGRVSYQTICLPLGLGHLLACQGRPSQAKRHSAHDLRTERISPGEHVKTPCELVR